MDALDLASLWQHEEALRGKALVLMVQPAHVAHARAWVQLANGQAPEWDLLCKPFSPRLMVDVLEALVP